MLDRKSVEESPPTPSTGWSLFGVELDSSIVAADGSAVGGDWCDFFPRGDGIIAFSIGDVCGHGEETFAARIFIREAIREAAGRGLDPAETLASAHQMLRLHDENVYATAICGLLDVRERFSSSSQTPATLRRSSAVRAARIFSTLQSTTFRSASRTR